MLICSTPPLHLTYCLNVHPGESWSDHFAAIREKTLAVRDAVAPGERFGLGMRLGAEAAAELAVDATRQAFKEFLDSENLYVFTMNGFPYGRFHGERVKESVYAPDWRTPERLKYTVLLAELLADLLPEGVSGSLSTVPGSFKAWVRTEKDIEAMLANLLEIAAQLHGIREATGKEIHLGLEPEPSCFLETTRETVDFLGERVFRAGARRFSEAFSISPAESEEILRRHIGVCFDTCHVALQFEDLAEAVGIYRENGIRISKFQISAALAAEPTPEAIEALEAFDEPVYLHQGKARDAEGGIRGWDDLPDMLKALGSMERIDAVRVHFHVPLFHDTYGPLRSTFPEMTPKFVEASKTVGCEHFEIETYTFDVLPKEWRELGVVDCIAREYGRARELLGV
jgi:sugar phosphate isomerase/epimerase